MLRVRVLLPVTATLTATRIPLQWISVARELAVIRAARGARRHRVAPPWDQHRDPPHRIPGPFLFSKKPVKRGARPRHGPRRWDVRSTGMSREARWARAARIDIHPTGMSGPRKVHIKSYGCQMNVYDSHRMADMLAPQGFVETATAEDADVVILNTCHIREKASEKVFSELG